MLDTYAVQGWARENEAAIRADLAAGLPLQRALWKHEPAWVALERMELIEAIADPLGRLWRWCLVAAARDGETMQQAARRYKDVTEAYPQRGRLPFVPTFGSIDWQRLVTDLYPHPLTGEWVRETAER